MSASMPACVLLSGTRHGHLGVSQVVSAVIAVGVMRLQSVAMHLWYFHHTVRERHCDIQAVAGACWLAWGGVVFGAMI
jgi:hypothetical protein